LHLLGREGSYDLCRQRSTVTYLHSYDLCPLPLTTYPLFPCHDSMTSHADGVLILPLLSECGTHETVRARFWPWLSDRSPQNRVRCSWLARKRLLGASHERERQHQTESGLVCRTRATFARQRDIAGARNLISSLADSVFILIIGATTQDPPRVIPST